MNEQSQQELVPPKRTRLGVKLGLVGAGLAAGVIVAGAVGANAATSNTASNTPSSASQPGTPRDGSHGPANHGADPVRSDEKSVTSAQAAAIKAAALKAVPGGTVYRVETDAGDGAYEAHMTKSDGTEVTVKFDKNLKVTKVESGMGSGDPRPAGQAGGTH